MKNDYLLSIVAPVWNGADTIGKLVDESMVVLNSRTLQIIFYIAG